MDDISQVILLISNSSDFKTDFLRSSGFLFLHSHKPIKTSIPSIFPKTIYLALLKYPFLRFLITFTTHEFSVFYAPSFSCNSFSSMGLFIFLLPSCCFFFLFTNVCKVLFILMVNHIPNGYNNCIRHRILPFFSLLLYMEHYCFVQDHFINWGARHSFSSRDHCYSLYLVKQ